MATRQLPVKPLCKAAYQSKIRLDRLRYRARVLHLESIINLLRLAAIRMPNTPVTFSPSCSATDLPSRSSMRSRSAFNSTAKAIASASPRSSSLLNIFTSARSVAD